VVRFEDLPGTLKARYDALRQTMAAAESVAVGFSGGVDSTLLVRAGVEVLGERCVAVTTISPTLPAEEIDAAKALARQMGVQHRLVALDELELPGFKENDRQRCAVCKTGLVEALWGEARTLGLRHVAIGSNKDDLADYRPGHHAAVGKGALTPMVDAGLGKADVRRLAHALGLANWDKPSMPCLSSRIPYGTEITPARLAAVWHVEKALHRLGFRIVRVRHHGAVARIEVGVDELADALRPEVRAAVTAAAREAGFEYVALDLEGYRQGSLNEPGYRSS
jgi:uncharacterized protein